MGGGGGGRADWRGRVGARRVEARRTGATGTGARLDRRNRDEMGGVNVSDEIRWGRSPVGATRRTTFSGRQRRTSGQAPLSRVRWYGRVLDGGTLSLRVKLWVCREENPKSTFTSAAVIYVAHPSRSSSSGHNVWKRTSLTSAGHVQRVFSAGSRHLEVLDAETLLKVHPQPPSLQ